MDRKLSDKEWHRKFMYAAKHFGEWSKCMSRQIGSVLVKDKTIIATGYNGPPRNVPHCDSVFRKEMLCRLIERRSDIPNEAIGIVMEYKGCPRKAINNISGSLLEFCPAGHSERNAITNAAREGVSIKGADLYCYCPLPCQECAKSIINAGIKTVYYLGGEYDDTAQWLFDAAHIRTIPLKDIL